MTSVVVPARRRRHALSPRQRRAAARSNAADVPAVGVLAVEIECGGYADACVDFTAVLACAALRQLRVLLPGIELEVNGRPINAAADLTPEGLSRRLRAPSDRSLDRTQGGAVRGRVLAVYSGAGVSTWPPLLRDGDVAAIGIGAPIQRPVVLHTADGDATLALRRIAHVTLVHTAAVHPAVAADALSAIALG